MLLIRRIDIDIYSQFQLFCLTNLYRIYTYLIEESNKFDTISTIIIVVIIFTHLIYILY